MECIIKHPANLIPANVAKIAPPKDYPWKVFSSLVEDLKQFLSLDDHALLTQIIRDRDFEAYSLLDEMWGLQSINSHSGGILPELRAKYQLASLLKKFQFETDRDMRKNSAIKKFKQAEVSCSTYNHSGYKDLVSNGKFAASIISDAQAFLRKLLGDEPMLSKMTEWSRHGPGSNLDTLEGRTDMYNKYRNWPYSCTECALPYARFTVESDPRWMRALTNDYRQEFGIAPEDEIDKSEFWKRVFQITQGNRIDFVPKNARTERSIAIEPTMNLFLQLGVDGFIRRRLKRWDVDLDSQVKNQLQAQVGSISNDYVTFDMAAASDSISLKLCELLLPPSWFRYLCKIRSPKGVLEGESFVYEKISSMGNGYTFALESALFAAINSAAISYDKGNVDWKTDITVFGDDIIVPTVHTKSCLRALQICGFQLNQDKSFFEGPVRESCGADWYKGSLIRPVFFTKMPKTIPDLFVDYNRLRRILSLRWGIEDSNVCKSIKRWIPKNFWTFNGPCSDESFDSFMHCKLTDSSAKLINNMLVHKRLQLQAKKDDAPEFFFRLLMHNLKGGPPPMSFSKGPSGFKASGNRFDVESKKRLALSYHYSRTETWCVKYNESIPAARLV